MMLLWCTAALAGEVSGWVGGAVGAQAGWQGSAQTTLQAELDASFTTEMLYGRLDLDVWVDPFIPGMSQAPPEAAYLQIGGDGPRAKIGVMSPNMSLESWDFWDNYLPTFSTNFNGATLGRIAGADLGTTLGNGVEVYVFGGDDLDWNMGYEGFKPNGYATPAWVVGAGVDTEQDAFSTWSGVAAYPTESFYAAYLALEVYPHELVWVTLDSSAGLSAGAPFASGQLLVSVMPEATVVPVLRGEYLFDPDGEALGGAEAGLPDGAISLGAHAWPLDWLNVQAEAKASFFDGEVSPGVFVSVAAVRAEPEE